MLRHSLARRMLERGAQLPEVQRVLGHSRLSTTGVYLTPSEEDLRSALGRASLWTLGRNKHTREKEQTGRFLI